MTESEFAELSGMHYGICTICKALAEGGYETDVTGTGECDSCGSQAVMGLEKALIVRWDGDRKLWVRSLFGEDVGSMPFPFRIERTASESQGEPS